jgi:two-component system, NarL family, response regulator LiaR
MSEPIRLLLIDDHAIIRQGIKALLRARPEIEVVGEAGSGEEGVALCELHAPDVVLLDLVMPGIGGVEAARRIKLASPSTHVIVLTSYHEDEHILPAIRAGALSYLLKDIPPEELVEAIGKAARGDATLSSQVATLLMQALQGTTVSVSAPQPPPLSVRELEVLRLIAEGLANTEIAEKLFVSEATIKSHVSNILGKLHLADRTQAAVYAWKQGIVNRGA